MSKILKRPMFRKGGQVMEGVMKLASGGRAKYQEAGRVTMRDLMKDDPYLQEVYDIASAGYGRDIQQERSDVLANLLIRGGLGLVSGEGAGKGTLGAIATAFKGPTEQALAEMSALKQDPAAMLTAKTAIEQKGAERLQRLKNQQEKTEQLYKHLIKFYNIKDENYQLVHCESYNDKFTLNINQDLDCIYVEKDSDIFKNIFLYTKVIENAKEIHCINSSFIHLVDRIAVDKPLFYHKIRHSNLFLSDKWKIVNYS